MYYFLSYVEGTKLFPVLIYVALMSTVDLMSTICIGAYRQGLKQYWYFSKLLLSRAGQLQILNVYKKEVFFRLNPSK